MIVDGKKLAEELKFEIKMDVLRLGKKLRLAVIQIGDNPVSEKFLEQKKKFGEAVGIDVRVYQLPEDISTNALRKKLAEVVHVKQNASVIVQLPLPTQINTQYILDSVIPAKDPDVLSSRSIGLFVTGRLPILPPIVDATKYIFEKHNIDPIGKRVIVVGAGRLVGKPISMWLMRQGATLTVVDEHTNDIAPYIKDADIIISGVGKPNFITTEMITNGAVVVDCGTSEAAGKLVGDVDPAIAQKASIFTPIPGGIGPLTIAMLFRNIVTLCKN